MRVAARFGSVRWRSRAISSGRVDEVGAELRHPPPDSLRPVKVRLSHGEEKVFLAFTQGGRLKNTDGSGGSLSMNSWS